jgi:hypothetical protein
MRRRRASGGASGARDAARPDQRGPCDSAYAQPP